MKPPATTDEHIKRLRYEAYHGTVAQTSQGSVLLRHGSFATEEDFDRDMEDLQRKWRRAYRKN